MIYYTTPYNTEKNIGEYYNKFISLLPNDDDWACFRDGDTTFLTSNYGSVIEEAIKNNPQFSAFTCFTNRIGNPKQMLDTLNYPLCDKSDDIRKHREISQQVHAQYGASVMDLDEWKSNIYPDALMSGFLFLVTKKTATEIKFEQEGMLGVDNSFHKRLQEKGLKIGIMKGVYLYHWHRGGENTTNHLT